MRHVLALSVWILATHVSAQDRPIDIDQEHEVSERDGEAQGLFFAGEAAYEAGRHDEALDYFQRSYELSGRSELLYNVGHAAQLAGQLDVAQRAFERFLEARPDSPHRSAVEERLVRIRARAERRSEPDVLEQPVEMQPELDAPSQPPEPSTRGPMIITISGLALAAAGGLSLGLAVKSARDVESVPEGTPWTEVEGDADAARRRRIVGASLGGAGVVLAALGVVLWTKARGSVDVALGPHGVRVGGTF